MRGTNTKESWNDEHRKRSINNMDESRKRVDKATRERVRTEIRAKKKTEKLIEKRS